MTARLRQVALVAVDLAAACAQLERGLGVRDPYRDPGVAEFGLTNAVYEIGDTFLEVVSPARDDTTAGRYLYRRGADQAGYMAIFQVDDTAAIRARAEALGVRTVWRADLPDISGTHLHPKDVPGAIVSFDTPQPPESWRWAGPRWTGRAPSDRLTGGRIAGITIRLVETDAGAKTWAALFDDVDRCVQFEAAASEQDEGISDVAVAGLGAPVTIGGVRFHGG